MNKLIITTILMTAIFASSVFASVPTNPPAGATGSLVLSLSYQVANDEDTGLVGYWALDGYTKTITVWHDNAVTNKYDVYASYSGTFCTFAGARSPKTGTLEPSDGCGTMIGGYDASFISVNGLQPNTTATTYDFGGTRTDIMKGNYTAGQTGPTSGYDWLAAYFPDKTGFDYQDGGKAWSWTYTFANGQTWVNDGSSNTGDVVTTPGSNTGHETNM